MTKDISQMIFEEKKTSEYPPILAVQLIEYERKKEAMKAFREGKREKSNPFTRLLKMKVWK